MDDVDVIQVGKTNYYAVRKGPFTYRIAEEKKFDDREHCWQVKSDQGRPYYVNLAGDRKWNLPDINLTEAERKLQELRKMEARAAKASDPAYQTPNRPSAAAVAESIKSQVGSFYSRDAAALLLKPSQVFAQPQARKPVFRVAKAAALPYFSQGLMDKRLFAQVVSTCTREFFQANIKFEANEQKALEMAVSEMCLARIEQALKKGDYQKVIEDLEHRVRDLLAQKKEDDVHTARLLEQLEGRKEEILKLKTKKRDVLLNSFRHLTKAGLIKMYWERWNAYRIELAGVSVREKAADEMQKLQTRVIALENELREQRDASAKVAAAAKVSNAFTTKLIIVNECLRVIRMRSLLAMMARLKDSHWEKRCWALQKIVDHCPSCEARPVEHERTVARLTAAYNTIEDTKTVLKDKDRIIEEQRQRADRLEAELNGALAALKQKQGDCLILEKKHAEMKDLYDTMRIQTEGMMEKENVRNSEMRFLEDELSQTHRELDNANRTLKSMIPNEEGLAPFFTNEAKHGASRALDLAEDTRLRRAHDRSLDRPYARRRTGGAGVVAPDPTATMRGDLNRFGPYIGSPYLANAMQPNPMPQSHFDEHQSPPSSPTGGAGAVQVGAAAVCSKCGLRLHLAPFCSKDGQRHQIPKVNDINDAGRVKVVAQQTYVPPVVRPNFTTVSMPAMQLERVEDMTRGPRESQELVAYMRDTRVAAMRRPPDGRTPDGRHLRPTSTQVDKEMNPSWHSVFQTEDIHAGAFGMPSHIADPLFGIYTKDQALATPNTQKQPGHESTTLQQQMATPSFFRHRI